MWASLFVCPSSEPVELYAEISKERQYIAKQIHGAKKMSHPISAESEAMAVAGMVFTT